MPETRESTAEFSESANALSPVLATHALAEGFCGHPGGAAEGDAKAVDALVAGFVGDRFNFLCGLRQEFLRTVNANALQFVAGSAAEVFDKGLVHTAPGHAGDSDDVFDANGFVAVFPEIAQAACDALVLNG